MSAAASTYFMDVFLEIPEKITKYHLWFYPIIIYYYFFFQKPYFSIRWAKFLHRFFFTRFFFKYPFTLKNDYVFTILRNSSVLLKLFEFLKILNRNFWSVKGYKHACPCVCVCVEGYPVPLFFQNMYQRYIYLPAFFLFYFFFQSLKKNFTGLNILY